MSVSQKSQVPKPKSQGNINSLKNQKGSIGRFLDVKALGFPWGLVIGIWVFRAKPLWLR